MRRHLLAVTLAAALTAAGCAPAEPAGPAPGAREDSLVLALGDVTSSGFDPRNGWGQHLEHKILHSSLVEWDSGMRLTGDLARDWHQDGTTWIFELDPAFHFSDGEPVTADDVVFTLDTLRADGTNVDLGAIAGARAASEHTVVIELTEPDSLLGPLLATIPILPAHAYGEDYSRNPVGSGPYRVVEHQHGEQLLLTANEHYPEDLRYQRLTLLLHEEETALAAAGAGDVDIVSVSAGNADRDVAGMDLLALDSVDSLGIVLPTVPAGHEAETMGITGPAGHDVTADPAIRAALAAAVDRAELNDLVLGGHGQPAYSFTDGLPWHSEKIDYRGADPDGARTILAEAGWEDTNGDGTVDHNGTEAVVPLRYPATDPTRADLAAAFSAQAEEIGIRFEPEGVSWDDIYAEGKSGAVAWALGSLSPKELYETYSSHAIDTGYNNMASYSDAGVDKHLAAARSALTLEDSYDSWRAAQEAGASSHPDADVPVLWLLRRDHLYLVREGIDIGEQVVHGHGHGLQIFQNVSEWS